MPDPVPVPAPAPLPTATALAKPGWQTSEFWKGLAAMALTALFASGILTNNTALAIAGIAASMLTSMGYTVSRTMVKSGAAKAAAAATAALLLVSLSTSSGCAASQRESTIKAAMVTVDTARDGFIAYDAAEQSAIVSKATSLEDGKAKLAAYRAERAKVADLFTVAYRAIAAATLNDDPSVAGLKAALDHVLAAVAAMKGGTP